MLSALPETMRLPSGLNATLDTVSVWPVSGWPTGWPVSASHSRTVLSKLPETIRLPSGLNATLITVSVCPVIGVADRLAGVGVPQPQRAKRRPAALNLVELAQRSITPSKRARPGYRPAQPSSRTSGAAS